MTRPHCPKCSKVARVTGSRLDGPERIQYLGCRKCQCYSLGTNVIAADAKRTRAVSSKYQRDRSGRFAKAG